MPTNIVVPALGESVLEATIARWLKQQGDAVSSGEAIVELETDKVDLEIPADRDGILVKIARQEGEDVQIGDVLGVIEDNGTAPSASPANTSDETRAAAPATEPTSPVATDSGQSAPDQLALGQSTPGDAEADVEATPVAKRMAAEERIDLSTINGSGLGGRVTKGDVENYIQEQGQPESSPATQPSDAPPATSPPATSPTDPRGEERVRMSRRRRTIAERLVMAQQTAAMLTTFNEIDMSAVMDMRRRRQEQFVEANGIKLGYTSFFVKAVVAALNAFPLLNAEIQENEFVLKHYHDIGIAVGAEEGLVVPVLRDAGQMSFAAIEKATKAFVGKSRDGTLAISDLMGGTFTITNGGVFGSMLSTPILNPPQVGILGLHKIEDRPVVIKNTQGEDADGKKEIAIRPMMYTALSYDHRIVDGREAVQFLVKVKELIEDPEELLLAG